MNDGRSWYVLGEFQSVTYVEASDKRHQSGRVSASLVKGNIPVSNGVVHLIGKPLIIPDNKMIYSVLTVGQTFISNNFCS